MAKKNPKLELGYLADGVGENLLQYLRIKASLLAVRMKNPSNHEDVLSVSGMSTLRMSIGVLIGMIEYDLKELGMWQKGEGDGEGS